MEYFPSKSVYVPTVLPLTWILTPGNDSDPSDTVPVTSCAYTALPRRKIKESNNFFKNLLFIIVVN